MDCDVLSVLSFVSFLVFCVLGVLWCCVCVLCVLCVCVCVCVCVSRAPLGEEVRPGDVYLIPRTPITRIWAKTSRRVQMKRNDHTNNRKSVIVNSADILFTV